MPRFVVLRHDPPDGSTAAPHWDFMLEAESVLRTWALESPPAGTGPIAARQLADHRPVYLDYEGPISGNRGSVVRWAAGTYELLAESAAGLRARLSGDKLSGLVQLTRSAENAESWCFERLD